MVVLVLLAALGACGGSGPPRGVVLVVVDTLRADHLGLYGHPRPTSPRLDAFAGEAVVFENAIAPSPWTLPSVATLMTGLSPSLHGAHSPSNLKDLKWLFRPSEFRPYASLHESRVTLAEVLGEAGFATGGFVQGSYPTAAFGMAQGFDHWSQNATPGIRWDVEDALAWLDDEVRGGAPFFVYLHVSEVHAPYTPVDLERKAAKLPPERMAAFRADMEEERERFAALDFDPGYLGKVDGSLASLRALARSRPSRRDIAHLVALYDRQIAYVDHWLGQLFDGLAERGLWRDTVVVVTSDHGEEFLDHGGLEHSFSYYEEMLRVPLLLRVPGGEGAGVRIARPVGLVDVMPTLLALLELPAPPLGEGESLRDLWRDGSAAGAASYLAEASFRPGDRALRTERFKYVSSPRGDELYDLVADPGEKVNRCREESDTCARLRAELARRSAEAEALAARAALPEPEQAEIDEDTLDELKALGYAE